MRAAAMNKQQARMVIARRTIIDIKPGQIMDGTTVHIDKPRLRRIINGAPKPLRCGRYRIVCHHASFGYQINAGGNMLWKSIRDKVWTPPNYPAEPGSNPAAFMVTIVMIHQANLFLAFLRGSG